MREPNDSEPVSKVMRNIWLREYICPQRVVLYSDNGNPMKGAARLATLQAMGVVPSLSRPVLSYGSPFPEPLFKTLKYWRDYLHQAVENLLFYSSVSGRVCALV